MKKLLTAALILLACGQAFAEDASVLPANVGRVFLAPVFAFSNAQFDFDGNLIAPNGTAGDSSSFSLGAALEYGITDWMSAAVQWAPAWSNPDGTKAANGASGLKMDINGPSDLFLGAKFRLNSPLPENKTSNFAFSVAPGVKIPLPGFASGKTTVPLEGDTAFNTPYNLMDTDKHAWGFGARAYLNYYFTDFFYLNLYNEMILYPMRSKSNGLTPQSYDDVQYGPDVTVELEPHIEQQITEGLKMGFGLPVEFKYAGAQEYYLKDENVGSTFASSLWSVKPKMSALFTALPLPVEISGEYVAPIGGLGAQVSHKVIFQIKSYFKIP